MDSVKEERNQWFVKCGKNWEERTNFTMKYLFHVSRCSRITQDSGYIVEVTRAYDGLRGRTHFRERDTANGYSLETALNASFRGGALSCYFKGRELFFIRNKLDRALRQHAEATGEVCEKVLLRTAGQHGTNVFLNEDQVIDLLSGSLIDPSTLEMVWVVDWPGSNLPREDLFHRILTPIDLRPLQEFLDFAAEVLQNNFGAALLAWCAMYMLHKYRWILKNMRHFNLPILYGKPTVGKTLVAQCGAWLNGCTELQFASRVDI